MSNCPTAQMACAQLPKPTGNYCPKPLYSIYNTIGGWAVTVTVEKINTTAQRWAHAQTRHNRVGRTGFNTHVVRRVKHKHRMDALKGSFLRTWMAYLKHDGQGNTHLHTPCSSSTVHGALKPSQFADWDAGHHPPARFFPKPPTTRPFTARSSSFSD